MGLFSDNVNTHRTHWDYTYTGAALLPYAEKVLANAITGELEARQIVSKAMLDVNVRHNDPEIERAKRDVVKYGTLKEESQVWVLEFRRNPSREFTLGLGDVTFFGLNESVVP